MFHKIAGSFGAILLAAGGSSRLGRSKQLIEIEGEALVRRQAKLLSALAPSRVVVVTGAERSAIGNALDGLPLELVHNPDWQRGMGASLACGIRAMPERVRAALLLLCDQWRVEAGDLEKLVACWAPRPLAAVAAAYEDSIGPPVVLPRALFEKLSRLRGDSGARRVLKRWPGEVLTVPLPNAAFDLDEPADLDALANRAQSSTIRTPRGP